MSWETEDRKNSSLSDPDALACPVKMLRSEVFTADDGVAENPSRRTAVSHCLFISLFL